MKNRLVPILFALVCAAPAAAQSPGANPFGAPGAPPAPRVAPPATPSPLSPTPHFQTPPSPSAPPPNVSRIAPPPPAPPARAIGAPAPGWTGPAAGDARARGVAPEAAPTHGHESAQSRRHWRRHRPITPYEVAPREMQGQTPPLFDGTPPAARYQTDHDRPQAATARGAGYGRRCMTQKRKVWRKGRLVRRWIRRCR